MTKSRQAAVGLGLFVAGAFAGANTGRLAGARQYEQVLQFDITTDEASAIQQLARNHAFAGDDWVRFACFGRGGGAAPECTFTPASASIAALTIEMQPEEHGGLVEWLRSHNPQVIRWRQVTCYLEAGHRLCRAEVMGETAGELPVGATEIE